jgi:hypothetical protein
MGLLQGSGAGIPGASSVTQAAAFGAIAYSPLTGSYGYSWGAIDPVAAERAALRECQAEDAQVVARAENMWLALAQGRGREWGAAWEPTRALAKERALAACRRSSADARLLVSVSAAEGLAAANPAAGWYPDPRDGSQRRYWDGEKWTEHTQASGTAAGV